MKQPLHRPIGPALVGRFIAPAAGHVASNADDVPDHQCSNLKALPSFDLQPTAASLDRDNLRQNCHQIDGETALSETAGSARRIGASFISGSHF